jgi:hypothetical protein
MVRPALSTLFGASTVVALAGFGIPWIAVFDERELNWTAALSAALVCCVIWLATVVYALVAHRARGFWLVAAAPFALWWLGFWGLIVVGCAMDQANCL